MCKIWRYVKKQRKRSRRKKQKKSIHKNTENFKVEPWKNLFIVCVLPIIYGWCQVLADPYLQHYTDVVRDRALEEYWFSYLPYLPVYLESDLKTF